MEHFVLPCSSIVKEYHKQAYDFSPLHHTPPMFPYSYMHQVPTMVHSSHRTPTSSIHTSITNDSCVKGGDRVSWPSISKAKRAGALNFLEPKNIFSYVRLILGLCYKNS